MVVDVAGRGQGHDVTAAHGALIRKAQFGPAAVMANCVLPLMGLHSANQRTSAGPSEELAGTRYFKILAARAITSPRIMREQTACTVMASLAQRASGITSVGLNAVASVKPR